MKTPRSKLHRYAFRFALVVLAIMLGVLALRIDEYFNLQASIAELEQVEKLLARG